MKRIIILFCFFISAKLATGQCPPGAEAFHSTYLQLISEPPVFIYDTSCTVILTDFPPNAGVYIYDNTALLIDSLVTDSIGRGYRRLSNNHCLDLPPLSAPWNTPLGMAVSGFCSVTIYRGAQLLPIKLKAFTVTANNNKVTASWQLEDESKNISYNLLESTNGADFHTIYSIQSNMSSTPGKQYQYSLPQTITGKLFYRLKVTEASGPVFYSPVKTAYAKEYSSLDVFPAIGKGNFSVTVSENFIGGQLQLFNMAGAVIQSKKITTPVSNIIFNAGVGIYRVRVLSSDGDVLVKTIIVQ